MQNYITPADWEKLAQVLMELQIPYHVSFDSHVDEGMRFVTYDTYIRIEPVIVQKEVKL